MLPSGRGRGRVIIFRLVAHFARYFGCISVELGVLCRMLVVFVSPASRVAMRVAQLRLGTFFFFFLELRKLFFCYFDVFLRIAFFVGFCALGFWQLFRARSVARPVRRKN